MPLRAVLNKAPVVSIDMSSDDWRRLKSSYRKQDLRTVCCNQKAIPKTSALGLQFFSHPKMSGCVSETESEEHIALKILVRDAAKKAGWEATLEYSEAMPSGERWFADVFCTRGKHRIAIEIQCSAQTEDEFKRRQKKYAACGVRTAWIYKITRYQSDRFKLLCSKDVPVFGYREIGAGSNYVVTEFGLPVDEFVKGLLQGKLIFGPEAGDALTVELLGCDFRCRMCRRDTKAIIGLHVLDAKRNSLKVILRDRRNDQLLDWVRAHFTKGQLRDMSAAFKTITIPIVEDFELTQTLSCCSYCDETIPDALISRAAKHMLKTGCDKSYTLSQVSETYVRGSSIFADTFSSLWIQPKWHYAGQRRYDEF